MTSPRLSGAARSAGGTHGRIPAALAPHITERSSETELTPVQARDVISLPHLCRLPPEQPRGAGGGGGGGIDTQAPPRALSRPGAPRTPPGTGPSCQGPGHCGDTRAPLRALGPFPTRELKTGPRLGSSLSWARQKRRRYPGAEGPGNAEGPEGRGSLGPAQHPGERPCAAWLPSQGVRALRGRLPATQTRQAEDPRRGPPDPLRRTLGLPLLHTAPVPGTLKAGCRAEGGGTGRGGPDPHVSRCLAWSHEHARGSPRDTLGEAEETRAWGPSPAPSAGPAPPPQA